MDKLGKVTKKCAKKKEAEEIAKQTALNGGKVPPGSSLSFFGGEKSGAQPCQDGSYPKGSFFD